MNITIPKSPVLTSEQDITLSSNSDLGTINPFSINKSSKLERNRLWQSVRQSVSKFRSHFTRTNSLRTSTTSNRFNSQFSQSHLPENLITIPINSDLNLKNTANSNKTEAYKSNVDNHNNNNIDDNNNDKIITVHNIQNVSSSAAINPFATEIMNSQNSLGQSPRILLNKSNSFNHSKLSEPVTNFNENTLKHNVQAKTDYDINKEPWFHGVLPRSEVERLLLNQGDFLVRQTSKRVCYREPVGSNWNGTVDDISNANDSTLVQDKSYDTVVLRMVLSVCWQGHKHFILYGGTTPDEGWHLEDGKFATIRDLIEFHMKSQTPVTAKSGACLITPITKPDWELDNRDVKLIQKIGQGNFGDVYRGMYNDTEVAVKTCRVDMSASDLRRKFLQGETTALNFCHPNIVKLVGIAVRSYPIMIVMEYVPGGSLLNHLRKSKSSLSVNKLLQMSSDAANGMAYLESKNCIHRDLAARNCLVTDTGQLKIADFGMSREEHIYELSDRRGQIPIKWTAPEALRTGRYTIKCDVWSYGVLLWEIFTYGDIPYRSWTNQQTREMVDSGYRLPAPDLMPCWLRTIMTHCWNEEPDSRPNFANILKEIKIPNANSFTPTLSADRNFPNSQQNIQQSKPNNMMKKPETDNLTRKFSRFTISIKDKRARET